MKAATRKVRCGWCGEDPLYCAYHDDEWGVPVRDDRKLFEFLILEGAQGIRKSTALKVLASEPWFTDELAELGSKDAAQQMRGVAANVKRRGCAWGAGPRRVPARSDGTR